MIDFFKVFKETSIATFAWAYYLGCIVFAILNYNNLGGGIAIALFIFILIMHSLTVLMYVLDKR